MKQFFSRPTYYFCTISLGKHGNVLLGIPNMKIRHFLIFFFLKLLLFIFVRKMNALLNYIVFINGMNKDKPYIT